VACDTHPRLRHAYQYWCTVRPGEAFPGRQHIDPFQMRDFLPYVWMVDVQPEPFRLRYRLVGTRIVTAMGREVTGLWVDEAHPHLRTCESYLERSREVVRTGVPSWRRGAPNLWEHDTFSSVENLILPLAADGETIDMLFIVSVFYRDDGSEQKSW